MSTTHTGNDQAVTQCVYPAHPDDWQPHHAHIGYLCRPGYRRLEQQLAELPALTDWLHANLATDTNSAPDPPRVSTSKPMPAPIDPDIHDHLDAIREVLRSWTQLVTEERQLHGPDNSHVNTTATFLLAHLDWASEQLWIDDLCTEIHDLHQHAHALAPSTPRTYRMPAPCPTCDALELHRKDGDDYIACGSCGRLWSEPDYLRLVFILASEVDLPEWVPVAMAADRFGLNPSTVWKWKQRGLLQAKRDHGQLLIRLVCDVPETAEGVA